MFRLSGFKSQNSYQYQYQIRNGQRATALKLQSKNISSTDQVKSMKLN